jgi:hypothetical protein
MDAGLNPRHILQVFLIVRRAKQLSLLAARGLENIFAFKQPLTQSC